MNERVKRALEWADGQTISSGSSIELLHAMELCSAYRAMKDARDSLAVTNHQTCHGRNEVAENRNLYLQDRNRELESRVKWLLERLEQAGVSVCTCRPEEVWAEGMAFVLPHCPVHLTDVPI